MNSLSTEHLFCLVASYFLGSVPFGFVTARLVRGLDIREHGSKNVGATNVFRVVGRGWGILVLFLDALKGYLAVAISLYLCDKTSIVFSMLAGVFAIMGHSFPVWLKFKGGKGVATSLGVFLALAFPAACFTFLIWGLVFAFSRIISIASLTAALIFPGVVYWFYHAREGFLPLIGISFALSFFIFYTHRSNIVRLRQGQEKRLF